MDDPGDDLATIERGFEGFASPTFSTARQREEETRANRRRGDYELARRSCVDGATFTEHFSGDL